MSNDTKPAGEAPPITPGEMGDGAKYMAELGEMTPGEIADKLFSLGIQGRCSVPERCAAAAYLELMTGLRASIGATTWTLHAPRSGERQGVVESGINPQSVRGFIRLFDLRAYPRLIAKNGHI